MGENEKLAEITNKIKINQSCIIIAQPNDFEHFSNIICNHVESLMLRPLPLKSSDFGVLKVNDIFKDFRDEAKYQYVIVAIQDEVYSGYGYAYLKSLGDIHTRNVPNGVNILLPKGGAFKIVNAEIKCAIVISSREIVMKSDHSILEHYWSIGVA
jgi:hypothetical protein